MSDLEETLQFQLRAAGIKGFRREAPFHPTRKWRADFMFRSPDGERPGLLVEVEGGTWMNQSRHKSGRGMERDMQKYAEATLLGWHVIRVTGGMVNSGEALELIQRYFQGREES